MRSRLAALVAILALGAAGCLRVLFPDFECDDECFLGETRCDGNSTQYCILEPAFGCLIFVTDVDCDDRAAVCVNATCVCPSGLVACPPHSVCSDLVSDPANCGACGIACDPGGGCVNGLCVVPPRPEQEASGA